MLLAKQIVLANDTSIRRKFNKHYPRILVRFFTNIGSFDCNHGEKNEPEKTEFFSKQSEFVMQVIQL